MLYSRSPNGVSGCRYPTLRRKVNRISYLSSYARARSSRDVVRSSSARLRSRSYHLRRNSALSSVNVHPEGARGPEAHRVATTIIVSLLARICAIARNNASVSVLGSLARRCGRAASATPKQEPVDAGHVTQHAAGDNKSEVIQLLRWSRRCHGC